MKIDKANTYLSMVTNAAVLIGLLLVIIELRQNSKSLDAQIRMSLAGAYQNNLSRVITDPSLAALVVKANADTTSITFPERLRIVSWQAEQLAVLYAAYELYEDGTISDSAWRSHARQFTLLLSAPFFLEIYRNDNAGVWPQAFYDEVNARARADGINMDE